MTPAQKTKFRRELRGLMDKYGAVVSEVAEVVDKFRKEEINKLAIRNRAMANLGISLSTLHSANFDKKAEYEEQINQEIARLKKKATV